MSSYRVSIDLDKLGEVLSMDSNLIEEVTYKDGSKHRMVKLNVMERRQPSDKGATHYLKFDMYHKNELQGVNYYLGDCYPINFGKNQQAQAAPQKKNTDLPF